MIVEPILNFIRPPDDAAPKAVNRWRWNVALTLFFLVIAAAGAWSPWGFVLAADVDQKIQAAKAELSKQIQEVAAEQKEIRAETTAQSRLLKDSLAAGVASEIRLKIAKRCRTADPGEREQLNSEKERLQEQYFAYKGVLYREPGCAEL